jgi:hypothetical protein
MIFGDWRATLQVLMYHYVFLFFVVVTLLVIDLLNSEFSLILARSYAIIIRCIPRGLLKDYSTLMVGRTLNLANHTNKNTPHKPKQQHAP